MALPRPEIGLVIHFNYLWKREREQGRENARYARPCAIILAMRRGADDRTIVVVAPITHQTPVNGVAALEIPATIKQQLGLDEARSWVVVDEVNEFVWPGFDLQPNVKGDVAYGILPNRFYQKVRLGVLEAARIGGLRRVPR
jgi:hypothetical protein